MNIDRELERYIVNQVETGDVVSIATEIPRFDEGHWALLKPLHANERKRERIALEVSSDPTLIVVPMIDPTNGIIGIFGVKRPQHELLLSTTSKTTESKDLVEITTTQIRSRDEEIRDISDCSIAIIEAIKIGVITAFEDISRFVESDIDMKKVLIHLSRAECTKFLMQTELGIIEIGGRNLVLKEIPSNETHLAKIAFKGVHTSKRGKVSVELHIHEIGQATQLAFLGAFANSSLSTVLDSSNNARTLKLLQAAALFDQTVSVIIGAQYKIKSRTWIATVCGIENESELLGRMPELGQFFDKI